MFEKQQIGTGPAEDFDSDDIWKRSTDAIQAAEGEAQQASGEAADEVAPPVSAETQSPANRIDRIARSAATGQAAPESGPEHAPPAAPAMPEPPAPPEPMAAPDPAPRPDPAESPIANPPPPAEPAAEPAPAAGPPAEVPTAAFEAGPAMPRAETTAPGQTLTVGRGIRLVAKACECDGLTVDGHLEASAQARILTVSKGGSFIGSAEVAKAEIHGTFEGNLTVSERLAIHATGSVSGTTRYREITIEAGGQVSGNAQCLAGAPNTGG